MKLVNTMPTGTVGVGSAMPTSTVPSAVKPTKPTLVTPRGGNINPDAEERRAKKNPKVVPPKPPTRKITVPALTPEEQQKVENLDETVYNARGAEREGRRTVVGGEAASTWRDARLRAASAIGLDKVTTPGMSVGEQWRAGFAKGDSWRNSIMTLGQFEETWSKNLVLRGARTGLGTIGGMIASQGKLNPLAPISDPLMELYRGNRKGAIKGGVTSAMMQLFMLGLSGAALEGQRDTIAAVLKQNGIPDEYLEGSVQAYIDAAKIPTYINMTAAGTVNDAQIIGMTTALGAILAPMTGGASVVAGIGIGWGLGTLIAGANNVLAMFSANTAPNLYSVIPYNAYEDPEFLTNGWTESEANKSVANYLASQDPDRFVSYDDAQEWITKYYSNSTPIVGDPRNKEIYDLVKQGYFVNKTPDGSYGIDPVAWQSYMIESALYKNPEDRKEYLPELTTAGREFAAGNAGPIPQETWNNLWRNPSYLQYEP